MPKKERMKNKPLGSVSLPYRKCAICGSWRGVKVTGNLNEVTCPKCLKAARLKTLAHECCEVLDIDPAEHADDIQRYLERAVTPPKKEPQS